eukprot:m.35676 g.35676  ORF g.35676 m.35676 type:complete len:452 (-) comp17183_c0_seq1:202-1557(-)
MDAATAKRPAETQEIPSSPAKKSKLREKHETSIILSLANKSGSLKEALNTFSACDINLTHIESRPSASSESKNYDFFLSTDASAAELSVCLDLLKTKVAKITVLDENPTTDNPTWYPRKIRDLDTFATRVLESGRDLKSDHPGFIDPVYRARRKYFADIALEYKHGEPIPHVHYTEVETKTWTTVFTTLKDLYKTHACEQFNRVFPLLELNCGYKAESIPQLEEISQYLHSCTGFRLRPVAGLLSSRDFLAGLAFRVFHSTQYIRHETTPLYTPEPDVCHELLGHVPLFADLEFAEFSQEIGLASLGASDPEIERLATLYWFTIEFGLCRENGKIKAFGAGLLSSFGELQYALTDEPKLQPFEPAVTSLQSYPITEYQPVYFVTESFDSAKKLMIEYASSLSRPFNLRYNPYTENIELMETSSDLRNLAEQIRTDMGILIHTLNKNTGKSN